MSEVRRFVVTATGDPSALLGELAERAGLRATAASVVERTFLDTPDGRLDAAGMVLELRRPVETDDAASLVWLEDGRPVATAELDSPAPPRFVADLPPWPPAARRRPPGRS